MDGPAFSPLTRISSLISCSGSDRKDSWQSCLKKPWDSGQFFIFLADVVVFQKIEEVAGGTVALSQILANQAEQAGERKWQEPW